MHWIYFMILEHEGVWQLLQWLRHHQGYRADHLLQVLLWVAMEPPEVLTRDAEGHEGCWRLLRWFWHHQGYHAESFAAGVALGGHGAARGLDA